MRIIKRAAVTMLVVAAFLLAGCEEKEKEDFAEYRNNEVSYSKGESCVERYLLYDSGDYERYIAGMYFGNKVPGINFGTLFETGYYVQDDSKKEANTAFYPKKQYDFDTAKLEYLGLEEQVPYSGTLTAETLTITWYMRRESVPIIYTRQ